MFGTNEKQTRPQFCCVICMGALNYPVLLKCGHAACYGCVQPLL